jgi:putative DNA primase/helicase
MIDGCIDWQMHGLIRPPVIASATNAYFMEQDMVRQWVEDCCDTTERPPHVADTFTGLFASWRAYAHARGEEAGGSKGFATRLQNLGFPPIKDECGIRGRGYKGLRARVHHETQYWQSD